MAINSIRAMLYIDEKPLSFISLEKHITWLSVQHSTYVFLSIAQHLRISQCSTALTYTSVQHSTYVYLRAAQH